jgi:hypothetical protein
MILGIASADRIPSSKSADGKAYWGGSGWIRIGQYLFFMPYKVVVGFPTWKNSCFIITDDDGNDHVPDVLILQRLMHDGLARHIKMARANGQKIINDLDDWYWGLSTRNAAWKLSHPKYNIKENINHYRGILSNSDIVTVSTPYLADRVSSFVKAPIVLIENTVDISRFTKKTHEDVAVPVLGWAGSTAHRSGDLETVASVLKQVQRNGQYSLMHVGHADVHDSFAKTIGVEEESVHKVGLLPADLYPSALTMDVGIVPLSNVPFNQAKSYIKGLEYAAAGIPFVAQNLDSYISLNKTYGIGRVAKHPSDWLKHLKALQNYSVRRDESLQNWERVQQRDVSVGARRWIDILSNI